MKVKKFTAKDMPEAMKKIRTELGEEAVILNSKPVYAGGILGFFKKKSIEVIAALDDTKASTPPKPQPAQPVKTNIEELPRSAPVKPTEDLQKEVQELKKMISSLHRQEKVSVNGYPVPIQRIDAKLKEQEINEHIRYQLIKELLSEWYRTENPDDELVLKWTKTYLMKMLQQMEFGPALPSKKIINLIGPTGVGKTTTIAKMAAYYHLEQKQSVAFITTDTYRIGAVEQLKTYAKILDLPIEVAYSIDDFQKAKEMFQDKDIILVDSAGRNFRNPIYVEELQKLIDFKEDMSTYLVLALTSKYKDMKKIHEQFSLIPIDKFIFTKKDETSYVGPMINMIAETNTGTAYVTNGQSVPDDIEAADPKKVTEWIFEEDGHA
ncbi:flagellar biosynthesis protein FlhF [Alteribacillus sp. YIM 98480]|uniref:flagellar biosynthesis protein FlhF n=1 Tax=Alteribacillus sp. YIM 98480 TaxID=2606599 RepID=UPI00131C343D|nr:flagellar biosynthesis protein FlhF [Alteribacillus sp. YIM 98480]